ncbi:MAG: hypothetical protein HY217_04335 [Candidatus Rokubacteria bacterium]|nr:hypothetical protein [Candidatus Rokubacteria bacterium]
MAESASLSASGFTRASSSSVTSAAEPGTSNWRSGRRRNLAARLQALAEPDRVVISAATHRLVSGFFLIRDLGPQALKGMSAPVQVFDVTGESTARSPARRRSAGRPHAPRRS